MDLPNYVEVVVVPHSFPKTKPKACNYGVAHAKGEYVVILRPETENTDYIKYGWCFKIDSDHGSICVEIDCTDAHRCTSIRFSNKNHWRYAEQDEIDIYNNINKVTRNIVRTKPFPVKDPDRVTTNKIIDALDKLERQMTTYLLPKHE